MGGQNSDAQSVFIATPSIDGALDFRYVGALLQSIELLRGAGIGHQVSVHVGNSIISDARNHLVAEFLASACTDLLFIDADMSWKPEDLLRLLRYDEPFVAAVGQRKDPTRLDFAVEFDREIVQANGLISVRRVGAAFLRLRRDSLLRLIMAHPEKRLVNLRNPAAADFYALFDHSLIDGHYLGEDYTFCDRWRALGGMVKIDPAIRLGHVGTGVFDAPLTDLLTPAQASG